VPYRRDPVNAPLPTSPGATQRAVAVMLGRKAGVPIGLPLPTRT